MSTISREDWTNTYTGMLDAAFRLTIEEQYFVDNILTELFTALNIPARNHSGGSVPVSVVLENSSHIYSTQRGGVNTAKLTRPVYATTASTLNTVPVSTWASTLLDMLTRSFPDLDAAERTAASATFTQILAGIGVPRRQAMYVPDDVVQMYLRGK